MLSSIKAMAKGQELSYREMSTDISGQIIPTDKKKTIRKELGYCETCPHIPVLLYVIKRSRLNPLLVKKKPREVKGVCTGGNCLKCSSQKIGRHSSDLSLESFRSTHSTTSSIASSQESSRGFGPFTDKTRRSFRDALLLSTPEHRSERRRSSSPSSIETELSRTQPTRTRRCSTRTRRCSTRRHSATGESMTIKNFSSTRPPSWLSGDSTSSTEDKRWCLQGSQRDSAMEPPEHRSEHRQSRSPSSTEMELSRTQPTRTRRCSTRTRTCKTRRHSVAGEITTIKNSSSTRPPSLLSGDSTSSTDDKRCCLQGSQHGSTTEHRSSMNTQDRRHEPSFPKSTLSSDLSQSQPTRIRRHSTYTRSSGDGDNNNESVHASPLIRRRSDSARSESVREGLRGRRGLPTRRVIRREPLIQSAGESDRKGALKEYNSTCDTRALRVTHQDQLIGGLEALFVELDEICSELFTGSLISKIELHSEKTTLRVVLCFKEILENLSTNILDGKRFVELGGHSKVIQIATLQSSHEVGELACGIAFKLAANEGARVSLILDGVSSFIVKYLANGLGNEKMGRAAFGALRIFSTVTAVDARQELLRHDISGLTADAMVCNPSKEVLRDGCAIIANIAYDGGVIVRVEKPIIKAVVMALTTRTNADSVIPSACFALNNLSFHIDNLRFMVAFEGLFERLESVTDAYGQELLEKMYMLRAEDESSAEQRLSILRASVANRSDDPDVVAVLQNALESFEWSPDVVVVCFRLLKGLSLSCEPEMIKALKVIKVDWLQSIAEAHAEAQDVQSEFVDLVGLLNPATQYNLTV